MKTECQNCGKNRDADELHPIRDIHERVTAGEPMPAGECPDCGALCHPVEERSPADLVLIAAAQRLYHDEGTIEVGDGHNPDSVEVSRGGDDDETGAYVQAWVWVDDADVMDEDRKGG